MKIPDCMDCGACCCFGTDWVEVDANEGKNLTAFVRKPDKEAWEIDGLTALPWVMRARALPDGRCVCLIGDIGDKVVCSIYEGRPKVCRKLERGSDRCIWFLGYHKIGRPY